MIDEDFVCDIWETLVQYIPQKDRQVAADHLVGELIDAGVSGELLKAMAMLDTYMENALSEVIEDEEEPFEDEDYE